MNDCVLVEERVDRSDLAVVENVVGGDGGGVGVSGNEGELEVIVDVREGLGRVVVEAETWRRWCLCLHHCAILVVLFGAKRK